jgi:hypothetical protein
LSVTFESGSRLSRIEKWAFFRTDLLEVVLPASVEFLSDADCRSLSSVTFESRSRLSGSQGKALIESGFRGATHQGSVGEISLIEPRLKQTSSNPRLIPRLTHFVSHVQNQYRRMKLPTNVSRFRSLRISPFRKRRNRNRAENLEISQ